MMPMRMQAMDGIERGPFSARWALSKADAPPITVQILPRDILYACPPTVISSTTKISGESIVSAYRLRL